MIPDESGQSPSQPLQSTDFMRLFIGAERRVRAYVRVLLPQREEAEEVFQEASVTMLEKFSQLPADADFVAWACRICSFKVMEFRQKQKRSRLVFSEETIRLLAKDAAAADGRADDRRSALADCLELIDAPGRRLIDLRYRAGEAIDDIAPRVGLSADAVYKALSRLRHRLHACVQKRLAAQGVRR